MQLSKLLALVPLLTSSVVSGYVIPEGTEPGAYLVTFDADGTPTTTKIGDLPAAVKARDTTGPLELGKRDSFGATGRTFPNHDDYNALTNWWRSFLQSGGTVNSRAVLYVYSGVAALAACNYKYSANWVPPQTIDQFNGIADSSFGWWKTGWLYSDPYQWTFWRDLVGTQFCTNLP